MAKVTVEIAQEINRLYNEDIMKMTDIADKLGLSKSCVCNYIWHARNKGYVNKI